MAAAVLITCCSAHAGDPGRHADSCDFLAGSYTVVGKELDSERTYLGRVVLRRQGECLQVERWIGGEWLQGTATIEHALGSDAADVLRVRFVREGKHYEITYLWRSDLDNYARLSGYLYQPGIRTETPGMEVLFIDRLQSAHPRPSSRTRAR